jgi:carbonic anhydrase
VANLVVNTDLNLMSVLQYAVDVLKVKHILGELNSARKLISFFTPQVSALTLCSIVVGHYDCGGVKAAFSKTDLGTMDNWVRNVRDVWRLHKVPFLRIVSFLVPIISFCNRQKWIHAPMSRSSRTS